MSPESGDPIDAAEAASLFAALSDPTRLTLVDRLCAGGPQSIAQLTAGGPITRQAVTKHLRVLAEAGLAHDNQRGRERIWTLDLARLDEARRHLDQIEQQWDRALGRLKMFVEQEERDVME